MKNTKLLVATFLAPMIFLAPGAASATTSNYDASFGSLVFAAPTNPTEVLRQGNPSSPAFRYTNVITVSGVSIDALVSIVSIVNSESSIGAADNKLERIDDNDNSTDLEVVFNNSAADGTESNFVFDVDFVVSGGSTPVTLQNIAVTITDVDNNQFVQFSGLQSYRLVDGRDGTDVVAHDGGGTRTIDTLYGNKSVAVPSGSSLFHAKGSSSSSDSLASQVEHHVEARFSAALSKIRIKLGSFENGRAVFGVEFSPNPDFAGFTVATTSVSQPSFTKSYDANSGTGTVPVSETASGTMTVDGSLSTPGISRTGFDFAGWNTRADGTGVSYLPGSSISPIADTVLYAMWTAVAPTPPASSPSTSSPAAAVKLAATGVENHVALWAVASSSMIMLVAGAMLLKRRREHS